MKKRVISMILALALCLGLFPVGMWALADDTTTPDPAPVKPDPLQPGAEISSVHLTDEYSKSLNREYNATAVTGPGKDNLLFMVKDDAEKQYTLPADWTVKITPAWYAGRTVAADAKLTAAPTNAGTYTLELTVEVTEPDDTGSSSGSSGSSSSGSSSSDSSSSSSGSESSGDGSGSSSGGESSGDGSSSSNSSESSSDSSNSSSNSSSGGDTGSQPSTGDTDDTTHRLEGTDSPEVTFLADEPATTEVKLTQNFEISRKTLASVKLLDGITKPYDGRASYTLAADNKNNPVDLLGSGVYQADINDLVISGSFGFLDPKVGAGKEFNGSGFTLSGSAAKNYTVPAGLTAKGTGSITKADPPQPLPENILVIRNRRAQEYTFDLKKLLPSGDFPEATTAIEMAAKPSIDMLSFFDDVEQDIKIDQVKKVLTVKAKEASYDGPHTVGEILFSITSENYETFTNKLILRCDDKVQVNITGLEAIRPAYDGTPQQGYTGTPKAVLADPSAGSATPNITTFAYEYEATSRSESGEYGPTATPPTEPGTYKVTVSVPDSNPDYVGSWSSEFVITKATLTIRAINKTIKVDDPVPSLRKPVLGVDFTVEGLAPGHELRSLPELEYSPWADSVSPGEFTILISNAMVPDSTHYNPAITYVHGKLTVTGMAPGQSNPFSDVSEAAWYVTAVKYVHANGLMHGVSASAFGPTLTLTRGMMVTILYRMENEPNVSWVNNPFSDVKTTDYYYDAVRWATYNNIVNGVGDGKFAPNSPLTREQLAQILYNYTRYYKGLNVNKSISLDHFDDANQASSWGRRALQWACAEKLLTGVNSTSLAPQGTAIRAQVATILMRYGTNICPPVGKQ